jgi:hypothetical protein
VYACDWNCFYQDTGYTTFNVLTPLIKNGSIEFKYPDKYRLGEFCHITVKEELRHART